MCGLAGYLNGRRNASAELCSAMITPLAHRGPDDSGVWVNETREVVFGHRRLAIQDLSPEGHQPMLSASGRFTVAFNGEVYNFLSLKKELAELGNNFRGHSDTEILLSAIEEWGIEIALKKSVGMFAIALWDKATRTLTLARDRMGEKPLYFGWQGETFLFGSELSALAQHPDWSAEINRGALALFMRHSYVPAPHSIYEGIYKLLPGTLLVLAADQSPGTLPQPKPFWSVREVAESGNTTPFIGGPVECVDALESLLQKTIQDMMISDVPVGAFLSGGIDSSLVVAIMQSVSDQRVKSFSIGFHEEAYNEAHHAKEIARKIGTEHTELYVTPTDAINVIPKLASLYSEPFADSSQIPTFLVSQMTREHVTVALSGDGGDEVFAGYNRYLIAQKLWKKLAHVPVSLRSLVARGIVSIPTARWDQAGRRFGRFVPQVRERTGDKMHKLAGVLAVDSPEEMYRNLVTLWDRPDLVVSNANEPQTALTDRAGYADLPSFVAQMQYLDMISYLPDDILVKVDRAAMGVSLETRVPFLDHRVVEFAWTLPMELKIRNGESKWPLRMLLEKHIPAEMIQRPKMGFGVPIDSWLRKELRDWAHALLDKKKLDDAGFFNSDLVREKWSEHLSGKRNWQHQLWNVLTFQAWLENNG